VPHPLDNAVWHSLTGPRRPHGSVIGEAARFDPEVSVFAAVSDDAPASAFDDLRSLVGPGGTAVLFRPEVRVPEGWSASADGVPGVQLVATEVIGKDDDRFVELGVLDAPEMLALVQETRPGPFGPRTVELGGYIGLREGGRLVAMAGERLRVDGFTEISAVCTAPTHQRRGLGAALVLALVARIRDRGDEAFLHAAATNESAIRLYLALGFSHRTTVDAAILTAPA
jgi:ribosomal protein S18 acetylase RimI-like enzyme